jgi:hypothetical protein
LDGRLHIGRSLWRVHMRRPARRHRRYYTRRLVRPSRGRRCIRPARGRRWWRGVGPSWRRRRAVGVTGGTLAERLTDRARHDNRGQNCNQLLHICL